MDVNGYGKVRTWVSILTQMTKCIHERGEKSLLTELLVNADRKRGAVAEHLAAATVRTRAETSGQSSRINRIHPTSTCHLKSFTSYSGKDSGGSGEPCTHQAGDQQSGTRTLHTPTALFS